MCVTVGTTTATTTSQLQIAPIYILSVLRFCLGFYEPTRVPLFVARFDQVIDTRKPLSMYI